MAGSSGTGVVIVGAAAPADVAAPGLGLLRCCCRDVKGGDRGSLLRLVNPLSTALSWAIVLCSALITASNFGIDVQPLLAFGSVGTLAIGLASQGVMSNVVSAMQLFSTRPVRRGLEGYQRQCVSALPPVPPVERWASLEQHMRGMLPQ